MKNDFKELSFSNFPKPDIISMLSVLENEHLFSKNNYYHNLADLFNLFDNEKCNVSISLLDSNIRFLENACIRKVSIEEVKKLYQENLNYFKGNFSF